MRPIICVSIALISLIACVSLSVFVFKNEIFGVQKSSPLVRQTTNGPVEGIKLTSSLGQKYYAFRGIPYAAPPITGIDPYTGEQVDRRFKAPEPFKFNWSGTLKADKMKPLCQKIVVLPSEYDKFEYSEDCLFINIVVPAGGAKKKPVLVFIHGGGLDGGSSFATDLGPDFFLTQDNIVVHLKYRTQIFGFLNLGFGEYTGNMGLKDEQLGFKWIHENIEHFSGNKDEILLIGSSIGGAHVHAHTLNKESRKYFTRAFIMSGSLNYWKLRKDNHVPLIQKCLQIYNTNPELVDYLKIANYTNLFKCNHLNWAVSVENPNVAGGIITKTPEEIYNSENPPVLDTLFSFASQESLQYAYNIIAWKKPILEDWRASGIVLPFEGFNQFTHPKEYEEAMKILKNAYFPDPTNFEAVKQANIGFRSDLVICDDILKTVIQQAHANTNSTDKSQHKNTFLMRSSMHSDLNTLRLEKGVNYTGCAHSDDLCYMFHCHFLDKFNVYEKHLTSKDNVYDIIMRTVRMITNFARFGDPSIEGDIPFKSCKSSDEIYCYENSNDPKMRLTLDIKKQLHYDTWREIEKTAKIRKIASFN